MYSYLGSYQTILHRAQTVYGYNQDKQTCTSILAYYTVGHPRIYRVALL